jgi:hypothetical protein
MALTAYLEKVIMQVIFASISEELKMNEAPAVISDEKSIIGGGALVGRVFSMFFSGFPRFVLLTLIILAPYELLMIWMAFNLENLTLSEIQTYAWVGVGLSVLLAPLTTASPTFGVFQKLRGEDKGIMEWVGVGLSRMLPVLGVALATGLILIVGFAACVAPGIILINFLFVAPVVAVVENMGIRQSLQRSQELSKGYRANIFVVVFVLGVVMVGFNLLTELAFGEIQSWDQLRASMLIKLGLNVITTALAAVAPVIVYQALRQVKEDVDVEEIASVFD